MKKISLTPIAMAIAMAGMTQSNVVTAAGFALAEQNGSDTGTAFAGGAALAEDASTIFYNPAGLTRVKGKQFIMAGHAIKADADFSKDSATTVSAVATGGNGGNAGSTVFVPNLYFSMEINPTLNFGIGVNAPFGLKTNYDSDWVGRYQALKSDLKTININPALAWKVSDKVSLGAGVSAQYVKAELSKAVDFGALLGSSQSADGLVEVEGDDWSYGFNLGALFQLTPATRVGLAYRSKITQDLSGTATYSDVPGPLASTFVNTDAKASVTLPETVSLSAFSQIDPKWSVMGDITWTRWNRFKELRVDLGTGGNDTTQENWRNTYRVAIGANYQLNDTWKLRGGLAYDQSPVEDEFRTPRIPDNDRTWIAFGANYRLSKASAFDFGYMHGFVKEGPINKSAPPLGGTLVGKYDLTVDILSAQYTYAF